jgi:hypothetical protein
MMNKVTAQVLFTGWNERGSEIVFIVYFISYSAHMIAQRVSFVLTPLILLLHHASLILAYA